MPDANGALEDVVLGFDDMKSYQVDMLQIANKIAELKPVNGMHVVQHPISLRVM